jgi:hypothetical protein
MEYQSQKSKCNLCNKDYTQRGLAKHISSCIGKKLYNKHGVNCQYIIVRASFNHDYFFHLLLMPTCTFHDLDKFLRKKWLECCGHMSAFTYEKWGDEIPMSRKINKTLLAGTSLEYQYDFGSATELEIKCIGNFTCTLKGNKKIQVLSRNEQPLIPCDKCGENIATQICVECQWDEEGWLCDNCAPKHMCGDEYFLPVLNSPRTGVCGYDGE